MKLTILTVLLCATSIWGHSIRAPGVVANECTADVCLSSAGCRCATATSPIETANTPQLVTLTFDDAVTDMITSTYHLPLLSGRRNADGSLISATFYVPHEWSDYSRVNELYNAGFEIGVNSISKNALSSYWQTATVDELVQEFDGQRTIVSTFANVPAVDVVGARTPNLELSGNRTFTAYQRSGILFDSSWPTFSGSPLFPYTLDYRSSQTCMVGTCPNEAFPGIWVAPIVNMVGVNGIECNNLHGCGIIGDRTEVYNWLVQQFRRVYTTNRTPITLSITSAFYAVSEGGFEGVSDFLDYLNTLNDVFLVSHSQVISWLKNPVPVSSYSPNTAARSAECFGVTCPVLKDEETRYLRVCNTCPQVYPWLGNPLGQN